MENVLNDSQEAADQAGVVGDDDQSESNISGQFTHITGGLGSVAA